MKKLALGALLVVLLSGSALAHNGAISLYTDETITICNAAMEAYQSVTIGIYYVRDQGPDMGSAAQFKIASSNAAGMIVDAQWSPLLSGSIGQVDTGISLAFSQCLGQDQAVAYIGTITVFYADVTPVTFNIRVVEHPEPNPPAISITECDPLNPIVNVLGGWFVFNGSCNPGVEPQSWGAIKGLFR